MRDYLFYSIAPGVHGNIFRRRLPALDGRHLGSARGEKDGEAADAGIELEYPVRPADKRQLRRIFVEIAGLR
ncbi:hypothetical protein SDC9_160565 [bioreactor metagenome]|uniref:Uncharacterized protein n=1 Tax=bioreactor metagenome TaxID=1076179 RepID=A0A645FLF6_9ZZZZ